MSFCSAFASSASGQVPFDRLAIWGELQRKGLPQEIELLVYGIPAGTLSLSDQERQYAISSLISRLPDRIKAVDVGQLQTIAPLAGGANNSAEAIWEAINQSRSNAHGLVFFEVVGRTGPTITVKPKILLQDGQTLYFALLSVDLSGVPQITNRLEAVIEQFAQAVVRQARDRSVSLAINTSQEGVIRPPSSASDCRTYVGDRMAQSLHLADTRLNFGDEERRTIVQSGSADIAIGITLIDGTEPKMAMRAPALGLIEPVMPILSPTACVFADFAWSDMRGSLLDRLLEWTAKKAGHLSIKVADPPIIEGKAADFLITSEHDSASAVCFYVTNAGDAVVIGELGFVPLSKTGAELLFELISQRYERGATLITSNLPFDEWTETFGTERLTGALLDRLTHHVNILEMNGESYRLAQSQARKASKTA